ncbi:MAG: hypothetical protein P4L34_03750 [Paludibacter sp.]|nr:hypothetical protein [Paludibacter sp.]
MNKNILIDPWCIVEEDFNAENQLKAENDFCLGNGLITQGANFEEYFSGKTKHGSYIDGINNYNFDKTAKSKNSESKKEIINAPNWTGIIVRLNDTVLDLITWEVLNFKRILNMHDGCLERTFEAISSKGHHIQVSVKRFLSMAETEVGAISYSVKSLNFEGRISFMPLIDADFGNVSGNNIEPIWNVLQTTTQQDVAHLWTQIRLTDFHVCSALTYVLYKNNEQLNLIPIKIEKEKTAGFSVGTDVKSGDTLCLNKYVAILNSLNHPGKDLTERTYTLARVARQKGWNKLFDEHTAVWTEKWINADIIIDGDIETLQANRYKIFREILGFESHKYKFNN